jgi:hypothetical protein
MMDEFTDAEKLEQAIGNEVAIASATLEFLSKRGIDEAEYLTFIGEMFAPGWSDTAGDLKKIAHYAALNLVTMGCTTETTHEDGGATIMVEMTEMHDDPDWPIPIRPAIRASAIIYDPIMASLGLKYSWEETPKGLTLRISE